MTFTCFAVTDETYGKEGISTSESLAAYLGAVGNYTNPENELYKYMSYHFINRNLSVNVLFATITDEDKTNIFDTRYKNQVITTKLVDGEKMLNDDIPFVRTGIMSRNGTIHKVGGVMPVFEPTPVTVIWDLCSFADIESIVNAYGADNNIGELFSNPISARDYKVNLVNEKYGAFSSIDYKANESKMSYNTWAQLGYYKCKWLEDGSAENQYGANNHDLLSLNLGYAGWIEMQTPTIIKGKYKVELYYAGMLSLANFYAEGSMVRFNIDDNQKMAYLWKGLERNSGFCITSETLFNGIEFETSDTHTFKATIMDILAKTNSRYVQLWDYIKFTPIIE